LGDRGAFHVECDSSQFIGVQPACLHRTVCRERLLRLYRPAGACDGAGDFRNLLWRRGGGESVAERALGLYFVASLIFSALQLARNGADINYLLETYALGGTAAAMAYARWFAPERPLKLRAQLHVRMAALALIAFLVYASLYTNVNRFSNCLEMSRARFIAQELARIKPPLPPVLALDSAFNHPDPAAHAISDPLFYTIMLNKGKISANPLLERLARREFQLVVLTPVTHAAFFKNCRDHRIGQALQQNYTRLTYKCIEELWQAKK